MNTGKYMLSEANAVDATEDVYVAAKENPSASVQLCCRECCQAGEVQITCSARVW